MLFMISEQQITDSFISVHRVEERVSERVAVTQFLPNSHFLAFIGSPYGLLDLATVGRCPHGSDNQVATWWLKRL